MLGGGNCSQSYPPTSGQPVCSVASLAWGWGQGQPLPALLDFTKAPFWAQRCRLSPEAGFAFSSSLRGCGQGQGCGAWVYVPGDGRVKHGWSWDAHIRGQRWGIQREQLCHSDVCTGGSECCGGTGRQLGRQGIISDPPCSELCLL